MIKSILVCTDGSPHGDVAADYAVYLTQKLKARLLALHVLDSRMLEGPLMADISGWVGAQPYGAQLQQFRDLMQQKGEAVIHAFNSRCEAAGVAAETWIKMGHPPRVILEEEARAELLVMGQKGEHATWIGDMMGSNVERVVRHSVKPCLVTPDTFRPVSRILAAYDGSSHASQALREATELALALQVELIVLTVFENEDRERAEQISSDAKELVKAHDCKALGLVIKGRAAATILESARDENCSLIVLGAYGHTRIREMILGSTTTHVIARSRVPVMLVR
jgi:nucleotide-binding universal stress UspA family protein